MNEPKIFELAQPIMILNEHWQEIKKITRPKITFPKPAGCFLFNDGTTQNWTLDQLYDTNTQQKFTPYLGFTLSNSQNLALAASACPLIVPQVSMCDIYLESPDLSSDLNWQGIAGYSIDLYRTITSPCGEPPSGYYAQLQLRVIDTSDNSLYLFAEWDPNKKQFVFHPVALLTSYHFTWKPSSLTDPKYKVKQIRIRLTMPNPTGPGAGECAIKGAWLIGNVCPEK